VQQRWSFINFLILSNRLNGQRNEAHVYSNFPDRRWQMF